MFGIWVSSIAHFPFYSYLTFNYPVVLLKTGGQSSQNGKSSTHRIKKTLFNQLISVTPNKNTTDKQMILTRHTPRSTTFQFAIKKRWISLRSFASTLSWTFKIEQKTTSEASQLNEVNLRHSRWARLCSMTAARLCLNSPLERRNENNARVASILASFFLFLSSLTRHSHEDLFFSRLHSLPSPSSPLLPSSLSLLSQPLQTCRAASSPGVADLSRLIWMSLLSHFLTQCWSAVVLSARIAVIHAGARDVVWTFWQKQRSMRPEIWPPPYGQSEDTRTQEEDERSYNFRLQFLIKSFWHRSWNLMSILINLILRCWNTIIPKLYNNLNSSKIV